MSTTILFLGRRVRPLEPVPVIGEILGYGRTAAFRHAEAWPMVGSMGSRRVIVTKLADQLGLPYEILNADETESVGAVSS